MPEIVIKHRYLYSSSYEVLQADVEHGWLKHDRILSLVNQARVAWLVVHNMRDTEIVPGVGVVIASANIQYIQPAKLGDILNIKLTVSELRTTSCIIQFLVENKTTNKEIALVQERLVFLDMKTEKPTETPDAFRVIAAPQFSFSAKL